MVEVALIKGFNDRGSDAEELAEFLMPIRDEFKLCVNLIPYNPTPGRRRG